MDHLDMVEKLGEGKSRAFKHRRLELECLDAAALCRRYQIALCIPLDVSVNHLGQAEMVEAIMRVEYGEGA